VAAEKYDVFKGALLDMLPWLGPMKPATPTAQGRKYDVIEFEGMRPPRHIQELEHKGKPAAVNYPDILQRAQLEWLRTVGDRPQSWEAFVAVLSMMAARGEMSWMDTFHISNEMDYKMKKVPGASKTSKGTPKRNAWIRQYLLDQKQYGCGNFVGYLVDKDATMRVSFVHAPGVPRPIPATLIIGAREPLWDALQHQDDNGPVRFPVACQKDKQKRDWLMKAGRQFAFQLASFDSDGVPVDEEDKLKSRASIHTLQPDPKLRDLLRSKKLVSQLEVIAALAPRDVMKKEGLSEIVKAELTMFMRDAKARGEAVVFCLGSTAPHTLAQKVYLRAPIGDYGLQCGYLRWRDSPELPWARERSWENRICLCLQMP